MKHHVLTAALTLLAACLFAQQPGDVNIPAAAKRLFRDTYPAATHVKWEQVGANHEVRFMLGTKAISVVYDATGALEQTTALIDPSELPKAATTYIRQHYKHASVKDAAKVTKANGEVNYEAEVNKTDLIFDQHGKRLKQ